jgi:hypothetical protein
MRENKEIKISGMFGFKYINFIIMDLSLCVPLIDTPLMVAIMAQDSFY